MSQHMPLLSSLTCEAQSEGVSSKAGSHVSLQTCIAFQLFDYFVPLNLVFDKKK